MSDFYSGSVFVTVVCGINLKNTVSFGKSNPYVKIKTIHGKKKTAIITNNLNPEWNSEHWLKDSYGPDDVITFKVKNYNRFLPDDLLGEAIVRYDDIEWGQQMRLYLFDKKGIWIKVNNLESTLIVEFNKEDRASRKKYYDEMKSNYSRSCSFSSMESQLSESSDETVDLQPMVKQAWMSNNDMSPESLSITNVAPFVPSREGDSSLISIQNKSNLIAKHKQRIGNNIDVLTHSQSESEN